MKASSKNRGISITCSIFAVMNNETVDLLGDENTEDGGGSIPSEIELLFPGEFRKHYSKSQERIRRIGQGE